MPVLLRPILLLCATLLLSCGDGRTPLVIYSPHGVDLLTLVEERYEAANPQIDVRWLDMGSQEIYDRVRTESANPQCDVWFGGPPTILAWAAKDGLLESYRPEWADAVPSLSQGPDDLYFGLYRTPPLIVYNEDALSAEEAPQDWDELLDEKWDDKVLIRDPLASGTMRTIFGMIVYRSVAESGAEEGGFDWLRRLDAQTKEYVHNPALLHQKMVRQEGVVTVWTLTDILVQRQTGAPLGYRFPTSGSPVIDDSIALVAGGSRTEQAKAFIDWVGSPEIVGLAADKAFRLPARGDVPREQLPEWAQGAMDELVVAEMDWKMLEEKGEAWMDQWDRDVRGKGGE